MNSALAGAPVAVLRLAEEVEEDLLRLPLHRVFGARVIAAVVMIVPGADDGGGRPKPSEAGLGTQHRIGPAQSLHVLLLPIAPFAQGHHKSGSMVGRWWSKIGRTPCGERM